MSCGTVVAADEFDAFVGAVDDGVLLLGDVEDAGLAGLDAPRRPARQLHGLVPQRRETLHQPLDRVGQRRQCHALHDDGHAAAAPPGLRSETQKKPMLLHQR